MHRILSISFILWVSIFSSQAANSPQAASGDFRPRLIVVIVFDQFRADYLTRFEKRFLPALGKNGEVGGFAYLMKQGAYFPYGKYDQLQCMTGPGHAAILSGSHPYQSGISLNFWFDPEKKTRTYCAEDVSQATVGVEKTKNLGTSPKNFIGSTVGDELKNAGHSSKVVTLALKDRSAILMGGHRADLALWMDYSLKWISSRYYLPDGKLPNWVSELNTKLEKRKGEPLNWSIPGRFSHVSTLGARDSLSHPVGAELTELAAERAIEAFQLGRGKSTDLFAVSFSGHDYAGHTWGPNAPEMEELTAAEDRQVSKLLNYIRRSVPGGLKEVVFVFTADHGVAPAPDYSKENKIPGGRIDDEALGKAISARLNEKFGKPDSGEWIPLADSLNLWLNHDAVRVKKISLSDVEAVAKEVILKTPGVAHVFSASDYAARKLPPGQFERQILKTYYPGRSGDLVIIQKPFYIKNEDFAEHNSGYNYDSTIPIILAGPKIRPGIYSTQAEVIDIAPTLTFLTGVLPPALSEGRVLSEALIYAPNVGK